jgi:hypothetical protein
LRRSHLILESCLENISRRSCGGILRTLKFEDPSKPKEIVQIDACPHGMKYSKQNGDDLKFSCRKIKVLIQDEASTQYFKSIS